MGIEDFTLSSPFPLWPEIPDKTVPEYLLRRVKEQVDNGKQTFIIDSITEESFSFEEFEVITRSIASALYKRGFRTGDTFIYLTYDLAKLSMVSCGVWRCNGILRASYPDDTAQTLLERIEDSRAGWVYCDEDAAEMCLSVAEKIYWDVEVIVARKYDGCTSIYDLMMDDGTEIPEVEIRGEDPAMILCTSGTTGASKGAVKSHSAVLFEIRNTEVFPFTTEKPNLMISKATHITGAVFPLATLCSGNVTIVMPKITKMNIFKAVDTYKPGFIWAFPTFLVQMATDPEAGNYDFSSLELAGSGGAQVTPQIEKIILGLPGMKTLFIVYGLTESVPLITQVNVGNNENPKIPDIPLGSVGKLLPGIQMQIRDLDTEETLGVNCTGELCVKCPALFSKYLNNPQATEKAFVDGWFKTGDVGYYDENEFFFIVDRAKEIFKYLGNHVSPTEIEKAINEHPAVSEVCVIGIDDPEGSGGQVPRAFVTLKADAECTQEELIDFANEQLADYKHIRGGLYFVNELPKGKTGKVTRNLVEKLIGPE